MSHSERFYIGSIKQDWDETNSVKRSRENSARDYRNAQLFISVCTQFEKYMEKNIDRSSKNENELLEYQHNAIIGEPSSVTFMLEKIQDFLDSTDTQSNSLEIPHYYKDLKEYAPEEQRKYTDLAHAIFHEVYGFGPLAAWNKYPDSYAAKIIGRDIYMFIDGEHRLMDFKFSSDSRVEQIITALTMQHREIRINKHSPIGEVDLFTGERVSVLYPPRSKKIIITFRRFLIERVTFDDLIQKGTLPKEAKPLFKGISKTLCNVVIAGPPGTGKSTDIKAFLGERSKQHMGATVEKHFELAGSRDYPELPLVEVVADEGNFDHVMEPLLRQDIDYIIVGEVRRVEIEMALKAMERLYKGFLTTYHTWKPLELPAQWARLTLDQFPGRSFDSELQRVATSIDFIIVKSQTEDRAKKKIKGLYELRHNAFTGEISLHPIMIWDKEKDTWSYKFDLSSQLLSEMSDINKKWANIFVQNLKTLSGKYPCSEPVEVFNPIDKKPAERIAKELSVIKDLLQARIGE